MDKVKPYLEWLKKHHFWVLTGVVLLVSIIVWNRATAEVNSKFQKQLGDIKRKYDTLMALENSGAPNEKYIKAVANEEEKIRRQVLRATNVAFTKQGELLHWPEAVAEIAKLGPTDEIPPPIRDNYQNLVIRPELDRLFEKVRLRKEKVSPAAKNNQQPNAVKEFQGIVDWQQSDRQRLTERYAMIARPSTIHVRTTQEDLWVFESFIDIVLKLNEGATDQLNAVVKRIDMLDVAQWATFHDQTHPGAELSVEENKGNFGGGMTVGSTRKESFVHVPGDNNMSQPADKNPDVVLLDGRYLDADNRPVPPDAAFGYFRVPDPTGSGPPVGTPPFAEFKQMAVVMQFLMDQRRVTELLTACANSSLPIEVRQVLMHLSDTDNKEGDNLNPLGAPGQQNTPQGEHGPFDAVIEVRGIVYIYLEPDEKKLGTGSAPNPARRQFGVPMPASAEGI